MITIFLDEKLFWGSLVIKTPGDWNGIHNSNMQNDFDIYAACRL